MPWKECSVTQERLRFVARLLDGEGMSEVCRDFGISRKTGYKIFNRYRDQGSRRSPIARAGRCAMPTSCRTRWSG
jgi:transposase